MIKWYLYLYQIQISFSCPNWKQKSETMLLSLNHFIFASIPNIVDKSIMIKFNCKTNTSLQQQMMQHLMIRKNCVCECQPILT